MSWTKLTKLLGFTDRTSADSNSSDDFNTVKDAIDEICGNAGSVPDKTIQQLTVSLNPSGVVLPFAGNSTPTGYLLCDGSAVSRTTYADLFTAIGTTWGVGDGSTTFNVPDLRGAFLRGTGSRGTNNMANGNDFAGPALGSFENDQIQGHYHSGASPRSANYTTASIGGGYNAVAGLVNSTVNNTGSPTTDGTNGTPRTGDETRPFNAGVNYIIKT